MKEQIKFPEDGVFTVTFVNDGGHFGAAVTESLEDNRVRVVKFVMDDEAMLIYNLICKRAAKEEVETNGAS